MFSFSLFHLKGQNVEHNIMLFQFRVHGQLFRWRVFCLDTKYSSNLHAYIQK